MSVEPGAILTGLGAATVVIMLVFKDTILGLVASIQMSSNDMLKIGDWVEFHKYGADGTVTNLNLTTVKVQNWDKTITTIPTYAFISDAFKNWRGMEESGGRRIKRSIYIDMNSIKFCDNEMVERFKKFQLITDYVNDKTKEVESFNNDNNVDKSFNVNGRSLTNIGTFRAYVESYLKDKKYINHDYTFLIRQLDPTDKGVPIQLYIFLSEQDWVPFEGLQSDIFDHLFAVLPEFDLKVYQSPTGGDFTKLIN
jgi:miniconductance mechanosensitive channel